MKATDLNFKFLEGGSINFNNDFFDIIITIDGSIELLCKKAGAHIVVQSNGHLKIDAKD